MANYYFVGTRLPVLRFDASLEITFSELDTLMKDNLTNQDYAKSLLIRQYYDIQNIRAYWLKEELDPYGTMDIVQIEDALVTQIGFPDYVYNYMEKYQSKEDRIRHFSELMAVYFRQMITNTEGFLHEYLIFERDWRLVMVGLRAKKQGRDVAQELQFEDPHDLLVYQILAQKESKTFEAPPKYADLKPIFEKNQNDPLALHLELSEYRFNKIEEMLGFDLFSIDRILGYMIQLIIVEKWQHLSREKGIEIVDIIIKESK